MREGCPVWRNRIRTVFILFLLVACILQYYSADKVRRLQREFMPFGTWQNIQEQDKTQIDEYFPFRDRPYYAIYHEKKNSEEYIYEVRVRKEPPEKLSSGKLVLVDKKDCLYKMIPSDGEEFLVKFTPSPPHFSVLKDGKASTFYRTSFAAAIVYDINGVRLEHNDKPMEIGNEKID